jgi:hypothetical protein
MTCRYCRSRHVHFSHLHIADIPHLLLLQFPVRCRSCQERVYVGPLSAWKLAFPGRNEARSSRIAASANVRRNPAA